MVLNLLCPRCRDSAGRKDGSVRGKQRYLCKSCGYRFTMHLAKIDKDMKRRVVLLYLLGFSLREASKMLLISHVSASRIVQEFVPFAARIRKHGKYVALNKEEWRDVFHNEINGTGLFVREGIFNDKEYYFFVKYQGAVTL